MSALTCRQISVITNTQLRNKLPISLQKRSVVTLRSIFRRYQSFWRKKTPDPPYTHLCQLGDPVLRNKAQPVPINKITSPEIQKVLAKMIKAMRQYRAVGLSAPQIGISLRLMMMEFTEKSLKPFPPEVQKARQMMVFPLKIFINPELHIVNPNKVIFTEGCGSLNGFSASVPRFHEVEISGFDEKGKKHEWRIKGWPARIAQHEIDHLDGKLYIDLMELKTFQYDFWQWVNATNGTHQQSFLE